MTDMAGEQPLPLVFWLPNRSFVPADTTLAHVVFGACDPWHLLGGAEEVWVDTGDELSLLAAVAAVPRVIFEDDAASHSADAVDASTKLLALVQDVQFHDPFSGQASSLLEVINTLGFWRQLIDGNRAIGAVYGVAFWKRPSIAPMMWNGSSAVRFESRISRTPDGGSDASAAWIARTPSAILQRLAANHLPMFQIEDGFIRSVGLGADCVPPLSIVVDPHGAHYDPAQPSGLELLLATHDFTPETLDRARRLREVIVNQGITKYGAGKGTATRLGGDRRHVLVTGQVEDDQSVIKGGGDITSNLELLRRVRAVEPDAFIIYRPHPDVDAGHRKGYIEDDVVLTVADSIAREDAITSLIDIADDVHVLTSLAGFEALMRGKPVTTHGIPFYAGWGLTTDLGPVPPRRQRRRSLDELVAATLLLYPRYLDPMTRLPCPPEVLIERLSAGGGKDGMLVIARRAWGRTMAAVRNLSARHSAGLGVR
jgi:capsular polysaccharide export protein